MTGQAKSLRYLLVAAFCLVLCACGGPRALMPTPNIYKGDDALPLFADDLAESLKRTDANLLYATDRAPETDEDGNLTYGYKRSQSLAFGTVKVSISPEMTWDELVAYSLSSDRGNDVTIAISDIKEAGRFPRTPLPVTVTDDELVIDPDALAQAREAAETFQALLRARLKEARSNSVLVFVHGFNNDFEYATETLAEMWHFLGREPVPIVYSWPAGKGGLSGYAYDRESGEFTIFHLKNLLELLGETPEVENIHLLAHSRGTDVLTAAVRELILEKKNRNLSTHESLRVRNMLLAAPDLDMDVISQRFISEYLGAYIGDVTVYTSKGDRAIKAASTLFSSRGRIGTLSPDKLSAGDRELLKSVEGFSFIQLEERSDASGHGYFHSSPAASSDLIMTIRYGAEAGSDLRPLTPVAPRFWSIPKGYPDAESP